MWSHLGTNAAKHFTFAILPLPPNHLCIYQNQFSGVESTSQMHAGNILNNMNANGHSGLTTRHENVAFFVHPLKGWLGASPDALVFDLSSVSTDGIAEFKCPYSEADIDPKEACEDKSF